MSEYLTALVNDKKFYILPVCNLSINPSVPTIDDITEQTWIEWTTTGYSVNTTTSGNLNQYNNNMNEIIIPDYIKNLDIDYISFSSNADSSAATGPQLHDISSVVFNFKYTMENAVNPFILGNGTSVNLEEETKYICQCKAKNGALLKIDLKNIYSFQDIIITQTDIAPAPTTSPDKNNKCRPYNITLWKKFLTSSSTNKNIFLKNNSLPAGCNEYDNPYYIP